MSRTMSLVLGVVGGAVARRAGAGRRPRAAGCWRRRCARSSPPAARAAPRRRTAPPSPACSTCACAAAATGTSSCATPPAPASASSRGFGGSEVVQGWVRGGRSLVAEACRRAGAGSRARVTLRDGRARRCPSCWAAARPARARQRERRSSSPALERAGFDVTHPRGRGWADVLVAGAVQLTQLRLSGLRFETRDADLAKSFARARARPTRAPRRAPAPPARRCPRAARPTARTTTSRPSSSSSSPSTRASCARSCSARSYQGREMSGVEIARDVDAARRAPGLLHDGRAPRARVAVGRGGDGVRPAARPGAGHAARRRPAAQRARRHPAARQPRRLRLLAQRVRSRRHARSARSPTSTLVEAISRRAASFAYRRKNCNGEILGAAAARASWPGASIPTATTATSGAGRAARRTSPRRATTAPARARSPRPRRSGTTSARTT